MDFIQENYVSIIVAFIILVGVIIYIVKYEKDVLRKAALYAVARAEDAWKSGTGKIKFVQVYTYLKKAYPIITLFVSETRLSKLIEEGLETLKEVIAGREEKCEEETKDETTETEQESTTDSTTTESTEEEVQEK